MMSPEHKNLRELLEYHVALSPAKEFLFEEPGSRVFTYAEFDRAVNRTSNLLMSTGVRKGDRVALFLTNRVEYLILYFACFKLGAWAGPINALLKPAEVKYILANSGASIAVTESDLYSVINEAASGLESLRHIVIVDDPPASALAGQCASVIDYRSRLETEPNVLERTEVADGDEAVIIYTSGTTGKPKGVLLTHGNLIANARQIARWLRLTARDRSLMIMPLFHVNALMTTGLAVLSVGGSIVLSPRFSASGHWNAVSKHRVTYFGSVATMLSMLNNTYAHGLPAGVDTSSLRFALCGSAPVPVEVMKAYERLFSCPVVEGYGLSESTCRSTFNPIDNRRPGSVGKPIGNEVAIFDEHDSELGPGQIGEIVLRGPNVMKGYYHNEAANKEAFKSGWFHTGDMGYRDEDGFFYVIDRKGDMIIRAGENIYPREIDEVLYQHPKIKDAATLGVPDGLYGEEVKSFVVLRQGETATENELIEFCKERLAAFKCPKSIEVLSDIPKGPTGKLLKKELRRR
jgi:acyl-CoA synthetase (AMP-forming)/AMP-acid ligase II